MSKPIYYIKSGELGFGEKTVLEDISFHLYPRDKISLVGKNGCGKSTLMKVIKNIYELDKGETYIDPKIQIGYLAQDFENENFERIYDLVLDGLKYEEYKHKADIILSGVDIDGNLELKSLSGGQKRRAYLAKALIASPDILLLDEPTNHLDIKSVEWLESYVKSYEGAIITISHDRKFLENTTNKVWWLDRANLRKSDRGFKYFFSWQEEIIKEEERELIKLNKKLAQEKIWLSQGITARRKRNQRRLNALKSLREEQRNFQNHLNKSKEKLKVELENDVKKSRFIIEADNISFYYNESEIFKNFSIRVKKGEKIGLIGPNGSGKSTLIKVLIGELKQSAGKIKIGKNLDISYFDQHREELNPKESLKKTILPGGGDTVFLQDRTIHVASYLKQFLFDPKQLNAKVGTLSGGERNRLLLAKTLINPGNFLILDEPTNDLDMDTLDLLLELLADYEGTLIIVSHDRDFLDKLVTRTLIFTEEKEVQDYIGGYEDYLKFYKNNSKKEDKIEKKDNKREKQKQNLKISFKHKHLLDTLPKKIEQLENDIKNIEINLSEDNLYTSSPDKFHKLTKELEEKKIELEESINKWIEIEELTSNID